MALRPVLMSALQSVHIDWFEMVWVPRWNPNLFLAGSSLQGMTLKLCLTLSDPKLLTSSGYSAVRPRKPEVSGSPIIDIKSAVPMDDATRCSKNPPGTSSLTERGGWNWADWLKTLHSDLNWASDWLKTLHQSEESVYFGFSWLPGRSAAIASLRWSVSFFFTHVQKTELNRTNG